MVTEVVTFSVNPVLVVYLAGVLVGLWRTDGSWSTKLRLAILWPIGPLALVVVVIILLAAAPIAFIGPRHR
jgi:hypothetical protein